MKIWEWARSFFKKAFGSFVPGYHPTVCCLCGWMVIPLTPKSGGTEGDDALP